MTGYVLFQQCSCCHALASFQWTWFGIPPLFQLGEAFVLVPQSSCCFPHGHSVRLLSAYHRAQGRWVMEGEKIVVAQNFGSNPAEFCAIWSGIYAVIPE